MEEGSAKARFDENLEKAKVYLEEIQPGVEFDERGRVKSDPESLVRLAKVLGDAGFMTSAIAKLCGIPAKSQPTRLTTDDGIQKAVEGTKTKGPGYPDEFRRMISDQVARSREFSEICTNSGQALILAALQKSGLTVEDFKKITGREDGSRGLREALKRAEDTAFKALESYNCDLFSKVEEERDEARAYSSYLAAKWEETMARVKTIIEVLEPIRRMERLVSTYLLAGNVKPEIFTLLMDKFIGLEFDKVASEHLDGLNHYR